MIAEEALKAGAPAVSLERLQEEVRRHPADVAKRVFLFQLLCVVGEWKRALTQLQVAGELDPGTLAMVLTYGDAVRCEPLREKVFGGEVTPLVFGTPQRWVALLIEALRLEAEGAWAEASPLRDEAFALAPATSGTLDGEPFAWIADADPRLGPLLEVILEGKYFWVPWMHVRALRLAEPEDLRDLVWTPGEFIWTNGGTASGLIPARYPGSAGAADDRLRLARLTQWQEIRPGVFHGLGQRMLATDRGEHALLEVREVVADAPASGDEGGCPPESRG